MVVDILIAYLVDIRKEGDNMNIQIGGKPPIENAYLLEFGRERSRIAHEQYERWKETQPKKPTLQEVLAKSDLERMAMGYGNQNKKKVDDKITTTSAIIMVLVFVMWSIFCIWLTM